MFVNDLTGLCRNNVFGVDIASQLPMGFNAVNTIPYNWGLGSYNVLGQYFHPTYGVIYNRMPQTLGQGFGQNFGQGIAPGFGQGVAQGFSHTFGQGFGQGFGQNFPTFGQVNTPFLPVVPQTAFANPILAHNQWLANTLGYGINPFGVTNWNTPVGTPTNICR